MSLLEVEGLHVALKSDPDHVLVRDVCLRVDPGQVVGLVGESGSGKTLSSLAVAGLLPEVMTSSAERLDLDVGSPGTELEFAL